MSVETGSHHEAPMSYMRHHEAPMSYENGMQTGVGFFGYETKDEKKLKSILKRRKEELEERSAALERAMADKEHLEESLREAQQRDASDRATIESLREEIQNKERAASEIRAELERTKQLEAEAESLRAELANMQNTHQAELSKNIEESSEYQKAAAQIEEMSTQVAELTKELASMTKKFEDCDLERNKLASKLVIVEAQRKSYEALVNVEKAKVQVANQTVENASKVFQSTVHTLEDETQHNLEALNLRDKRAFDSNKIIRAAVKKASQMIAIPPKEGLNKTVPSSEIKANLSGRSD